MTYTGNGPDNTIGATKQYVTEAMDLAFAQNLKTAAMTPQPGIVEAGKTAGSIYLATPEVGGLGNYSKANGWTQMESNLNWTAYQLSHDRGAAFLVDRLDAEQSKNMGAVAVMAAEFQRSKLIPEIDATRLAKVADVAVAEQQAAESETLTKANILTKIEEALDGINDRTGYDTGNTIYVSTAVRGLLMQSSEFTRTRDIMAPGTEFNDVIGNIDGNPVVIVPKARMHSKVTYNNGATGTGGFTGAGSPINFAIVAPGCANGVISYTNITALPAGTHTRGDGDFWAYRIYHDCIITEQSKPGVYVSLSGKHTPGP